LNRAITLRFCFSSRADSHSAQLLSWHDDARCRPILPLPRRAARKAGALGSLWSSSMRAWNNVSARLHSAAAAAWPLSLSHSLTPVSPCGLLRAVAFAFGRCIGSKQPLRQGNSQQALGQREGRARPGRRSFWSRLLVFPVGFSRLWGRRRMNERPHLSGHNLFLGVPTPLLPPAPGPLAEFH
jgi:hypothetical protein